MDDIAEYALSIIEAAILASPDKISIQLDESTDAAGIRHPIAYVRYTDGHAVKEQLFFCELLENGGTAEALMEILEKFLSDNNIPISKVSSLCCDGAHVMKGRTTVCMGFAGRGNRTSRKYCLR